MLASYCEWSLNFIAGGGQQGQADENEQAEDEIGHQHHD
jgi:hypothetical protein